MSSQQKVINLLNEYYKSRATTNNSSDLVNMYLEAEPEGDHGKYKITALPTEGADVFSLGSGSSVRGMIELRNLVYAVVDNTFYEYDTVGNRTSRGTLNTSSGIVEIANIANQIMLVDGIYGYNYNTSTLVFTQITDPDFVALPQTCTGQDGMFLVSGRSSSSIYGSDVADGVSWNILSFINKSGPGDYVTKLISNQQKIWAIGTRTTQILYNSGAQTFSFEDYPGAPLIEYGTTAKNSVAKGMNTIFMLSDCVSGGKQVVMFNGFDPQPISTPAIDWQINQLTDLDSAIGFVYQLNGHEFYTLTFPTDAITLQYDLTTGTWASRTSYIGSSYTRWIANCYAYGYGRKLIGSYNSGYIYKLNSASYTENGVPILRRLVTPPAYAQGNKVFVDRLQIDAETNVGSDKTLTLSISKDSGNTFSTSYTLTIPESGGRMYANRIGMTQTAFVMKIETTMDAKFILLGAVANIRVGIH